MRRASIRGRRGALTGAAAAVVCLGGLLAACGSSGGGDGYVAVGAAGATPDKAAGRRVAPTGDVELVPLDGNGAADPPGAGAGDGAKSPGGGGSSDSTSGGGPASDSAGGSGSGSGGAQAGTGDRSDAPQAPGPDGSGSAPADSDSEDGSGNGGSAGGSAGGATSSPSAPHTSTPGGPAVLKVGDPVREAADKRWCEDVTLTLRNTGGSAVRSGKVTFGTHIIGALGIDWATVESTRDLPVPIDAGKKKEKTWTVCVDAWRVPLGMHVETRDVSVDWK